MRFVRLAYPGTFVGSAACSTTTDVLQEVLYTHFGGVIRHVPNLFGTCHLIIIVWLIRKLYLIHAHSVTNILCSPLFTLLFFLFQIFLPSRFLCLRLSIVSLFTSFLLFSCSLLLSLPTSYSSCLSFNYLPFLIFSLFSSPRFSLIPVRLTPISSLSLPRT